MFPNIHDCFGTIHACFRISVSVNTLKINNDSLQVRKIGASRFILANNYFLWLPVSTRFKFFPSISNKFNIIFLSSKMFHSKKLQNKNFLLINIILFDFLCLILPQILCFVIPHKFSITKKYSTNIFFLFRNFRWTIVLRFFLQLGKAP